MSNYIYDIVNELVQKYQTRDPFSLAEFVGIYINYPTLNNLKGFFCVMNDERHIAVNNNLEEVEQRLVVAHELGHERLHLELAQVSPMHDCQLFDMTSKPEYQANVFASELLLSDQDILSLTEDCMDYKCMAQTLEVDTQLLMFKLHAMNKRGYTFNLPEGISSRFLGKK